MITYNYDLPTYYNYDPCITETSHKTWKEFPGDIKPQTNKLLLLHVNLRSLLKNHAQLKLIIASSPVIIHLITITVTDSTKSLFGLDNYQMYTQLRTNRKGGNIIVYAHSSNIVTERSANWKFWVSFWWSDFCRWL